MSEEHQNGQQNGNDSSGAEEGNKLKRLVSVPFFSSSLRAVRFEVAWKWALTTFTLMAFILGVLSIYWATLFHAVKNLNSLVVAVVDFDGLVAPYNTSGISPIFGPAVMNMARAEIASGKPTLGFIPSFASDFNYDPIQVRQAVYDEKYWAAIIINANATAAATNAINSGDASYDPTGAAQLIFVQARDSSTWNGNIYPILVQFMTSIQAEVGGQWAKSALSNAASNTTLQQNLAKAPSAISPGIGFASFDLRPFAPPQATPSVTVGLIYLIILSFFSFSFYLPIYLKLVSPSGHPPLKFRQMVMVRYFGTMTAYLFLSLAYSLVSLAFLIDFSTNNPVRSDTMVAVTIDGFTNAPKFGKSTFVAYWTLNFIGMAALGLACENVAMTIGQPWTGLWLIFWVITNVSTSFYAIEVEPHFYYWGYAWPLHQVVEATRTLLFDLHNRLGLNYGVLMAWVGVNTLLFPLCCRLAKYKRMNHIKEYWA
ncbi:hypothetical protein ANO11243_081490 [Dothideomycetidae sp. 11243]|nr:hypothetical protein ANO11243_081490 [fungal sp. No.11243]